VWCEDNGLEIDAFYHEGAANDIKRAERLIEGKGLPLQFRGALGLILGWLTSLPTTMLDARPSLWVTFASVLFATGHTSGIEEKLQAAEKALQRVDADDNARDVVGRIAATRAMLAISQNQLGAIISQSRRALEYLHPDNLAFRTLLQVYSNRTLGSASRSRLRQLAEHGLHPRRIPVRKARVGSSAMRRSLRRCA
jgi:ATP/maltotriose-dependent transcriptional regulator MalT